ncbi:uncharacterized protein LOC143027401 [Oratosquilla oratoria]|uniref:uncharacterized protein LOC143027401 n=1 Tax=Oratosquilla oratoria TaxID=337810 RepID=UPI003F75B201
MTRQILVTHEVQKLPRRLCQSSLTRQGANYSVALPTATVTVCSRAGKVERTRAFFDQGSQRFFILRDLVSKLELKSVTNMNMTLDCFDRQGRQKSYEIVKLDIVLGRRREKVTMAVVEEMPKQITTPGSLTTANKLEQLGIRLADKDIHSDVIDIIQLLIGADFIGRFLYGTTTMNKVDLMQYPGEHLIYGIIPDHSDETPTSCSVNLLTPQVSEPSLLIEPRTICDAVVTDCNPIHKLWDLDVMAINPNQESPNDVKAFKHCEGTVKYEEGKYWVELPFKTNHPFLPHNYGLALGQMHHHRKRFKDQPELLQCYHNIIMEQLKAGVIEEVVDPIVSTNTHHLPHHAVRKQSATTPLRIVYNSSAKSSRINASLNNCLLTGPSLTEKLGDTLIKFRINQFAFVADIERAFLRIGLHPHHRDFTRFPWPAYPQDDSSEIKTYRFAYLLFGATCSPFLLQMTLKHYFKLSKSPFAELLSSSFYVDKLMGTTRKLLFQEAWTETVGWDSHLPTSYLERWNALAKEIKELPSFKFPRISCGNIDKVILHVFVDASTLAYVAVSSLTDGNQSVILTSKARVAPLKNKTTITLPQLELTALQLGTQLAYNLQNLLRERIKEVIIWSDSEATLQWVRNDKSNIPYVQNRVADIRSLGSSFGYQHVPSKENPADLVTRGISIRQFKKAKIWTGGPEWLLFREHWPTQKPNVLVCEIISERTQELSKVTPLFDYSK